jgi:hypothetical protein
MLGECSTRCHLKISQDVVAWNAILGGHAMHGHGKKALKTF